MQEQKKQTEGSNYAGKAIQKKDDVFVDSKVDCHDRVQKNKALQAQWEYSEMAVFKDA